MQFLNAAPLHRRHPRLLGGPFFTSVPAARIGTGKHAFPSNEAFQAALGGQEMGDLQYVRAVLPPEAATAPSMDGLGVSRLRNFLEHLLRERYLRSLASIIPQLQQVGTTIFVTSPATVPPASRANPLTAHPVTPNATAWHAKAAAHPAPCIARRAPSNTLSATPIHLQASSRAASLLAQVDASLRDFTPDRVQQLSTRSVHRFSSRINEAVQGSASPEAQALGQTLAQEVEASGSTYLLQVPAAGCGGVPS